MNVVDWSLGGGQRGGQGDLGVFFFHLRSFYLTRWPAIHSFIYLLSLNFLVYCFCYVGTSNNICNHRLLPVNFECVT